VEPLLRVVDDYPWPLPPNSEIRSRPSRWPHWICWTTPTGRELLTSLGATRPVVLARRSAKARAMAGPLVGRVMKRNGKRVAPSKSALEVLAIVAYRQPIGPLRHRAYPVGPPATVLWETCSSAGSLEGARMIAAAGVEQMSEQAFVERSMHRVG
jgi:hypothetical protein